MYEWDTYKYLYEKIYEFMVEHGIQGPCDPIAVCDKHGWNLIPYSQGDVSRYIRLSEDGFSVLRGNDFFIFYNDSEDRIRTKRYKFTIAHEIGHIYLYHHFLVPSKVLLKGELGVHEDQADTFAQNILMPFSAVHEYRKLPYPKPGINDFFEVSRQMSQIRIKNLMVDEKRFKYLIDHTCPVCGNKREFYDRFCRLCGTERTY